MGKTSRELGEARRVVSAHGALDDMGSSKRDYDGQFSVWHCLPRLRDEYHLGERGQEHWLQKPLKRSWFQPIASTAKNISGLEEGVARENHSHLMPLVHLRSVPLQHLGRVALVRLGRRNSSNSLLANRARAERHLIHLEPLVTLLLLWCLGHYSG